jgi:hypothetical protein
MPVATIDGLKVNYLVQGSGPHLLMPAAEIWNVLPPHQNGANVLAAIVGFKEAVEHGSEARAAATLPEKLTVQTT